MMQTRLDLRARKSASPQRSALSGLGLWARRSARPRRSALLGLALALVFPVAARAYVCSRVQDSSGNQTGASLAWNTRTISYAFNQNFTVQLQPSQAQSTVNASFSVWQNANLRADQQTSCSAPAPTDLVFKQMPNTSLDYVGYNYLQPDDNMNVIIFRDTDWEHSETTSLDIIALTTTTYNRVTGQIYDADIEFNTTNFTFTVSDTNVATDLMNTASHEIGHFLGFAHSLDEEATMFYQAPRGDTLKRYLSCDDVALLNFRYPAGAATGYCGTLVSQDCGYCAMPTPLKYDPTISVVDTDSGKGCQASPQGAFGMGWLVLAALSARWARGRGLSGRARGG